MEMSVAATLAPKCLGPQDPAKKWPTEWTSPESFFKNFEPEPHFPLCGLR